MLTETKILYFDLISAAFYMFKNGAKFWDMQRGIRCVPKPMLQLKLWKVKQCIYYRVHPKVYFCQKLVFLKLNHIRVIAFLFPYIRSHSKLICKNFAIKKSQSFCFLLKVINNQIIPNSFLVIRFLYLSPKTKCIEIISEFLNKSSLLIGSTPKSFA